VLTGSTSGVGYQAALSLAKAGAKLLMIVRNREKAEALCAALKAYSSAEHRYYLADFRDLAQVRKAALALAEENPHIDLLINNAGVHMTTRQLTPEGFETAFAVNHLASFLITGILLGRLKASAPSRIIQVNSEGHRFNGLDITDLDWAKRRYNGYKAYGASKSAQLLCVWEFHDLLQGRGVSINAMHPGAVKSNIGTNNGLFYNLFSRYLIQPTLKNPIISGDAIHYLASAPEMQQVSGQFFNLTNEELPARHARDRDLGREVFRISRQLTQLDTFPL
jgi:NAD(P)-dependent dehydrogenase (short-subunit alcohol dehydrogenase family)